MIIRETEYVSGLNREVELFIYVPEDRNKTYPVIYMHDGHNLFQTGTSTFGKTWKMEEALEQLPIDIMVVGINAPQDERRWSELCPFQNEQSEGLGDVYLEYVLSLKKRIDETYPTKPSREYTALAGSSLGGLITTYAMTKYNTVFSKYGLVSNAYWFDERIFELVMKSDIHDARVYLDVGTAEGPDRLTRQYIEDNRKMIQLLRFKDITLEYKIVEDAIHDEEAWSLRLPSILQFLFGDLI